MLELKPEYKLFFTEIKTRLKYIAKRVNAFIDRLFNRRYQYNHFTLKERQKLQQKNKSNKRRLKAL